MKHRRKGYKKLRGKKRNLITTWEDAYEVLGKINASMNVPVEEVTCPFGNCVVEVEAGTGLVHAAYGPVGCACDYLPGWRSKHYEGLPKPGWDVKAVGRHGGRIARSKRLRREYAAYLDAWANWLKRTERSG